MVAASQAMNAAGDLVVLPYSAIVGQGQLKRALELAYVAPALGGVLLSGQRGTAKSTAVRAFAQMINGELPVTLPINATDDRVVGGWHIDDLMQGKAQRRPGLVEQADKGILYIDEVNLLDDHIVNLILDVASTGVLNIQHQMADEELTGLTFTLVGTMNPEEGGLRPQLLDRFGLMVDVQPVNKRDERQKILEAVLAFDAARSATRPTTWLRRARVADAKRRRELRAARKRFGGVVVRKPIRERCARLGEALELAGHRGEYVTALGARALAAIEGTGAVDREHLAKVAPMALAHRTQSAVQGGHAQWTTDHQAALEGALS
ncbi:MAG: magnesium chelatase subunit [Solirubrobacteraceae bacterium]